MAARSKALRPLQQRVSSVEDSIVALEAQLEQANQELEQAAQDTDKDGIVRLSKQAAEVQQTPGSLDEALTALERIWMPCCTTRLYFRAASTSAGLGRASPEITMVRSGVSKR